MTAENLALTTAALNGLGKLLKNNPHIPDEWIPTILAVVGVLVSIGLSGVTLPVAIEGMIAGAAAVGVNQMYKQLTNGKPNETKPTPNLPSAPVATSGPAGNA